jgi:hypothetical protein
VPTVPNSLQISTAGDPPLWVSDPSTLPTDRLINGDPRWPTVGVTDTRRADVDE